MGGESSEREISLKTGKAVFEALQARGYKVEAIDLRHPLEENVRKIKVDVIFNALHGVFGEDGQVQKILEEMKIPYTGSGVESSALCMAKVKTKNIVHSHGILTPRGEVWVVSKQKRENFLNKLKVTVPLVVKPEAQGSTVGVSIVKEKEKLSEALEEAAKHDSSVMVEQFIEGRELTCTVLDGEAYPLVEIRPKSGFYDYESKYTKGKTEYLCPAHLPPQVTKTVQENTKKAFKVLKCRGVARADYILDKNNKAYFLEINTLPGMTETSLVPKAAKAQGVSFESVVEKILETASLDSYVTK